MKLSTIFENIHKSDDYKSLPDFFPEQSIFETYALLGELLNPNNAYEYSETNKSFWEFTDDLGFDFFVRFMFTPTGIDGGYYEIKMGWSDLDGQERYLQQKTRFWDDRRSDTIAKIYRDEIVPAFKKYNDILSNELIIKPLDIKRYQFSIRLIKKLSPSNFEIDESNKPKEIIIRIK